MVYIELLVFNLTNNIDEEATKKMIEEYRRNNQTLILKNRAKQVLTLESKELFIKHVAIGTGQSSIQGTYGHGAAGEGAEKKGREDGD